MFESTTKNKLSKTVFNSTQENPTALVYLVQHRTTLNIFELSCGFFEVSLFKQANNTKLSRSHLKQDLAVV